LRLTAVDVLDNLDGAIEAILQAAHSAPAGPLRSSPARRSFGP
jgi:hypothetical protein